jgi:archaellum component FlaF (FlaF/FlaG flagellin family)
MITSFQNIKQANTEQHKKMANMNIGTVLKTEDCEGGSTYIQVNIVKEGQIF